EGLRLALSVDAPDAGLIDDEQPLLEGGEPARLLQAGGEGDGLGFVEGDDRAAVLARHGADGDVDATAGAGRDRTRILQAVAPVLRIAGLHPARGREESEEERDQTDGYSHSGAPGGRGQGRRLPGRRADGRLSLG